MSSYKSKYVHLEISRPQQKQHLCFSRPRGSWYLACEKDPFLNRANSVLCKKLHGRNCSFSSRVALVALREVGSVVCGPSQRRTTKLFIPGHTTLVQPPITLDQALPGALRGNKANLVDRFQNVIQGTADDRSRGRFSRFSGWSRPRLSWTVIAESAPIFSLPISTYLLSFTSPHTISL